MEVKIQIPDNCELIKDGDTYIVREKKQQPPRSWEEFCERYPKQKGEAFIDSVSFIGCYGDSVQRDKEANKNVCVSEEEAKAFLALMQLRQLRKAWVSGWKPSAYDRFSIIVYHTSKHEIIVDTGNWSFDYPLTFPTTKMAEDFLNYFKDLCKTAKILL